jgi:hypothetical protein
MPWQKRGDGTWIDLETMQPVRRVRAPTLYAEASPEPEPEVFADVAVKPGRPFGATDEVLARCRLMAAKGHTPLIRLYAATVVEFGSLSLAAQALDMTYGGLKSVLHRAWFADKQFADRSSVRSPYRNSRGGSYD